MKGGTNGGVNECGALALYPREYDDIEVMLNGFGRWIWEVGKVGNQLCEESLDG